MQCTGKYGGGVMDYKKEIKKIIDNLDGKEELYLRQIYIILRIHMTKQQQEEMEK